MRNTVKTHDLHVYLTQQLLAYDLSLDCVARLLDVLFGPENGEERGAGRHLVSV